MVSLTKRADISLLFFALLSFLILGTFKFEYYNHIFIVNFYDWLAITMAVAVAVLIEGTRFSLLLASAQDARTGNTKGFVLGLLGSSGLLIYDFILCSSIGEHWENGAGGTVYTGILRFIVLLGALLEIRLCLLMSGEAVQVAESEQRQNNNSPTPPDTDTSKKDDKQVKTGTTNVSNPPVYDLGKYLGNTNSTRT